MSELLLKVNAKEYAGWEFVRIQRGISQIAASFSLVFTTPVPGSPKRWSIHDGDFCEIYYGGARVVRGWIDEFLPEYDAESHTIVVNGREVTCDLVDCSAGAGDAYGDRPRDWSEASLASIIEDLIYPWRDHVSVRVSEAADVYEAAVSTPFKSVTIEEGASAFETIAALCKARGVLPVSHGDGVIVLTRAGDGRCDDSLVLGGNVKKAAVKHSSRDRFMEYIVKGQGKADSLLELEDHIEPIGKATDAYLYSVNTGRRARNRPLVVIADVQGTSGLFEVLAKWEAVRRAGQSRRTVYTVQGWTQKTGSKGLWPINALVTVEDAFAGLDHEALLISDQVLTISTQTGTTCELVVTHPDAYKLPDTTAVAEGIKTRFDILAADDE